MTPTRVSGPERLAELGLSVDVIAGVLGRADVAAQECTELDPPIVQGLLRWGRTTRYLREQLIPAGWSYDNPRNLARTIHPSGKFAIVVATGDERTGLADRLPGLRHPRGSATEQAVAAHGQLAFEFNSLLHVADMSSTSWPGPAETWFLLFNPEPDRLRSELSLPQAITNGRITGWSERILLPDADRHRERANHGAPATRATDPAALSARLVDRAAGIR